MKVYEKKPTPIVRLSFGHNLSIAFEETTVDNVYDLAIRVFSSMQHKKVIRFTGSPFTSPKEDKLILTVRHELGAKKTNSRSKTMFSITAEKAKRYFEDNYKDHIRHDEIKKTRN